MSDTYDVITLGGGTAGYTAAIRAAQLGLKAAVVEKDKLGGVCLHRGCIPTKALLESAEVLSTVRRSGSFGVDVGNIELDYAQVLRRKDEIVAILYKNLQSVIQKQRVEVISGSGRLVSANQVQMMASGPGGQLIQARHVVVASGSRPRTLPGLAADPPRIVTSDELLELSEPPSSLVIIGGGAVGLEFASFFLDIGSQVTIVEALPQLLPLEDADLGNAIARILAARGAQLFTSARVVVDETRVKDRTVELSVEHDGGRKAIEAACVLVAIGRQGNTEGIGLENMKAVVENGFLAVDEAMRTAERALFAVGDVTGKLLLAHAAAAQGFLAAEAIADRGPAPLAYHLVPRVVYTRPQIAAVGLSEGEAKKDGRRVKTQRFSFRNNAMAQLRGETEGFAKVVFDQDSGELLGVHVIGSQAAELIGEAALAIRSGAHVKDLAGVHAHPSLSESLAEAAALSAGLSIYW